MLRFNSILLLFVLSSEWVCVSFAQLPILNDCLTSDFNRSVDFSILAHRNLSGHWITKFSVDNVAVRQPKKWKVEVNHRLTIHEGLQRFQLQGALIVPPSQPKDYKLFPSVGYYKFHDEQMGFDDAYTTCSNEGGHLAVINSKEEVDVLKSLFSEGQAHIGVHDRVKEGQFITIFGEPLQHATWANNEPDNDGGNENCVAVQATGLLNDVPCAHKLPFICEYDLAWAD